MIKYSISNSFRRCLGDRRYYQFARFLWHDSRWDHANKMSSNGEIKLLEKILKLSPASGARVFFDIGANVGDYSGEFLNLAAGMSRDKGLQLFCFEPNPACVEKIENRIADHELRDRATIVSKIVTDQPGVAVFYITGETSGTSSLRIDPGAQKAQKEIRAECVTLDGFCKEQKIEEVFFAKVDTEGNDLKVIEGGIEMLREGRIKYLQFEYNHRWILFKSYLKDIFELVEPLGYQVAKVTGDGLVVYKRWHYELEVYVEGNYLIGRDFSAIGLPLLADHSGTYW